MLNILCYWWRNCDIS